MRFRTVLLLLFAVALGAAADNEKISICYQGNNVSISPEQVEGLEFQTNGACVSITAAPTISSLSVELTGATTNGSFKLSGDCEANVVLNTLNLISKEGAPLWFNNSKATTVDVKDGTESHLIIKACKDTANFKAAAIYAIGDLTITGKGILKVRASGDGCKGVSTEKNFVFNDATMEVATTGDNLGIDTTRVMGPPGFGPGGPMEMGEMPEMPEEMKAAFEQMKKEGKLDENGRPKEGFGPPGGFHGGMRPQGRDGKEGWEGKERKEGKEGRPERPNDKDGKGRPDFPDGGFPGGGFPGGPEGFGGPDGFDGPGGMPGGKQKYLGTCKGVKAIENITINSGNLTVTTTSRGAEGIEGKKGITINGGTVYVKAVDDALSTNGSVAFHGGETTAWSTGNDAVDANGMREGAITITDGKVFAYSQVGAPEEGLDCDFAPLVISGGTTFSIGAGMGEMPSTPNNETAKQPTVLFIGLELTEGEPVEIYEGKGKTPLATIAALPFSFYGSSSILSIPQFEKGKKYTLKNGSLKKTFTIDENFTVVR